MMCSLLPPFVILNLFQDNTRRQFVVLERSDHKVKQVQHDEDFV